MIMCCPATPAAGQPDGCVVWQIQVFYAQGFESIDDDMVQLLAEVLEKGRIWAVPGQCLIGLCSLAGVSLVGGR